MKVLLEIWIGVAAFLFSLLFVEAGTRKCEDTVSDSSYINITDSSAMVIAHITDCQELVDKYLPTCKKHPAKRMCCASCSQQDLSCLDSMSTITFRGSMPLKCSQLVGAYPCVCREEKRLRDICCRSCREQGNLDWCDCQDQLSPSNPVEVTKTKPDGQTEVKSIGSCAEVAADHEYLCAKGSYDLGGLHRPCCNSCKDKCVDSKTFRTTVKARSPATGNKRKGRRQVCKNCSCAQIESLGMNHIKKACSRKQVQQACCAMCSE